MKRLSARCRPWLGAWLAIATVVASFGPLPAVAAPARSAGNSAAIPASPPPTATARATPTTPVSSPQGRFEGFIPLTAGSSYDEDAYYKLWAAIDTHGPFGDTCQCTSHIDNSMGLS